MTPSKFAPLNKEYGFEKTEKVRKMSVDFRNELVVCCVVDERRLTDGSEEITHQRKSL